MSYQHLASQLHKESTSSQEAQQLLAKLQALQEATSIGAEPVVAPDPADAEVPAETPATKHGRKKLRKKKSSRLDGSEQPQQDTPAPADSKKPTTAETQEETQAPAESPKKPTPAKSPKTPKNNKPAPAEASAVYFPTPAPAKSQEENGAPHETPKKRSPEKSDEAQGPEQLQASQKKARCRPKKTPQKTTTQESKDGATSSDPAGLDSHPAAPPTKKRSPKVKKVQVAAEPTPTAARRYAGEDAQNPFVVLSPNKQQKLPHDQPSPLRPRDLSRAFQTPDKPQKPPPPAADDEDSLDNSTPTRIGEWLRSNSKQCSEAPNQKAWLSIADVHVISRTVCASCACNTDMHVCMSCFHVGLLNFDLL